jgi:hypothetical protein
MATPEETVQEVQKAAIAVAEDNKKIFETLKTHEARLDAMAAKGERPEASAEHSATMKALTESLDLNKTALAAAQAELVALKASTQHDVEELQKAMQRSGGGGMGGASEPFKTLGERAVELIQKNADAFRDYAAGTNPNARNLPHVTLKSFGAEPAFMGVEPGDLKKALQTNATTNFIAPMQLPGYIPLRRRRLRMRDLIPIIPASSGGVIKYIRQTGFAPTAAPSSVTSITQTGGLATVTVTAHGWEDHDRVRIAGAAQAGYNGDFYIKVLTANTFTISVPSGTVSPATGTITAFRLNNYGAAGWVAEGGTKPGAQMFFEERTATVQVLAHHMKTSRQVLDDMPGLQNNINSDGIYGLLRAEDSGILYGSGTGSEMQGILTDPARQQYKWSEGKSGDTPVKAIRRSRTLIEMADGEASGCVLHPTVWEDIELETGSDEHYIWVQSMNGLNPEGEQVWRMPLVLTRQIKASTWLVGAFAQGTSLYDREQANVRWSDSNEDDFIKNLMTALFEERLAQAIRHPELFVEGTFDSAPTP